ncbi:hypothetical protein BJL90_04290 [Clostridium formicaceticum]|uniref:Uncharacterized protein n=1 Tax=Clostridium formicaceticum TaxID=1497 RepID=A0ABM6EQN9_9CLOT|nr:hypothetical protein [Clostridium formicaceticum]AOY75191.1 hypothetical protein BJL90_04290 [Clostridium formicaceticum]
MSLEEAKDADIIKHVEGIQFIVDQQLEQQLMQKDLVLDYIKNWFTKKFVITQRYSSGCC